LRIDSPQPTQRRNEGASIFRRTIMIRAFQARWCLPRQQLHYRTQFAIFNTQNYFIFSIPPHRVRWNPTPPDNHYWHDQLGSAATVDWSGRFIPPRRLVWGPIPHPPTGGLPLPRESSACWLC
jgi:hypothetical protein